MLAYSKICVEVSALVPLHSGVVDISPEMEEGRDERTSTRHKQS
jgi:hypothetical protein